MAGNQISPRLLLGFDFGDNPANSYMLFADNFTFTEGVKIDKDVVHGGGTGAASLKCIGITSGYYVLNSITGKSDPNILVGSIYFKFDDLDGFYNTESPLSYGHHYQEFTADCTLFTINLASGTDIDIKLSHSTHRIFINDSTNQCNLNLDTVLGQWVKLDFKIDASTGYTYVDYKVNGVKGPQYVIQQTATTITEFIINLSGNLIMWVDDIILSSNSSDYSIAPYKFINLRPNADGTHNNTTNTLEDQSGADIDGSSVYAYSILNKDWENSSFATWIRQSNVGSTRYVEVQFDDISYSQIMAVAGNVHIGSSNQAFPPDVAIAACIVRDSDGQETGIWGDTSTRVDYVSTISAHSNVVTKPTGGAWTKDYVNSLRARLGYANDTTARPYWREFTLTVVVELQASPAVAELKLVVPKYAGTDNIVDSRSAFVQGIESIVSKTAYTKGQTNVEIEWAVLGTPAPSLPTKTGSKTAYLKGLSTSSSTKAAYSFGGESKTSKYAYLRGIVNTSSVRYAYLQGKSTSLSNKASYLKGSINVVANKSSYLRGSVTTVANKSVYLKGTYSSSSNKPAYLKGSSSTLANKSAYLKGSVNVIANKSAYLKGSINVIDNQYAYLKGQSTFTDNQYAYVKGQSSSNSNKTAYLKGLSTSISNKIAYVKGKISVTYNKAAYLKGISGAIASKTAYTKGLSSTTANKTAFTKGSINLVGNKTAYLRGGINTLSNKYAYTNGTSPEVASNKSAYTKGQSSHLANKTAYLSGKSIITANKPAYLKGTSSSLSNKTAYIKGQSSLINNKPAYLKGLQNTLANKTAYLKGTSNAVSNKTAYIKGIASALANKPAYLYGVVRTSKPSFILGIGAGLVPDGYINSSGIWKDELGGTTNIYQSINEYPVHDDSDFIYDTKPATNDYYEFSLSNPSTSVGDGNVVLLWRGRDRTGLGHMQATVQLKQGITVITSMQQVLTTTPTTYYLVLTSGEKASITDWDDLRIRITVTTV